MSVDEVWKEEESHSLKRKFANPILKLFESKSSFLQK